MEDNEEGSEVVLHVYDLSQGLAAQLSRALTGRQIDGIWHTGVVVNGVEYYWGGELLAEPAGRTQYGRPVRVVPLGRTHIPDAMIREFVDGVRPRYNPATYSLLSHNCNNFSDELASFLTGHGIPRDIVGLPDEVLATPLGAMLRPFIEQMERQQKSMYGTSATLTTPALARQQPQQPQQPQLQQTQPQQPQPQPQPKQQPQPQQPQPQGDSLLASNNAPLLSAQRVYKPFVQKLRASGRVAEGVLASLEAALGAPTPAEARADPAVAAFFEGALRTWPVPECTPALYVVREVLVLPAYGAHYAAHPEGLGALCAGLARCGVAGARPAPCLLAMAAATNLFACAAVGARLRSTAAALHALLFATALQNVQSAAPAVCETAAALAYNFTLAPLAATDDELATLVRSLAAALSRSARAPAGDAELERRCLLALGHLLQHHPAARAPARASDLRPFLVARAADSAAQPVVSALAREVLALLDAPTC